MDPTKLSSDPAAQKLLQIARDRKQATAWQRHQAMQPQCGFGQLGLCCHVCTMGPCRIDPFGDGSERGVCGATADLITARNLARSVAAGAAAHSDHARHLVDTLARYAERGSRSGHEVRDADHLASLARSWSVPVRRRTRRHIAGELASTLHRCFGQQSGTLPLAGQLPQATRARLQSAGIEPRGIDREVVDLLHRTTHGVESDPIALLRGALRTALADGLGGSPIATDLSDLLFGRPQPVRAKANLGVLEKDQVNILVHGHEPTVSEIIARVAGERRMRKAAAERGARGINVAGICCTANEILMRQGLPVVGNYLHQELAILTGAVDLMVVDEQCIMPSLPELARCHHTKFVTTSAQAHMPGTDHLPLNKERPTQTAREIIERAIEQYGQRDEAKVCIPPERVNFVAGFTADNLPSLLAGKGKPSLAPLVEALQAGAIRGIVALVGCNTVRVKQDQNHLTMATQLIAEDVLVLQTGCSAIASAKAGLMQTSAARALAGRGLRKVCEALGIPPVLHVGSCVDNSRVLRLAAAVAQQAGVDDLSALPIAAAAPEAMSEKALAIGFYAVASGIMTAILPPPPVAGSARVTRYLERDIEKETGGKFLFTEDPSLATAALISHLDGKRAALGLRKMPVTRRMKEQRPRRELRSDPAV